LRCKRTAMQLRILDATGFNSFAAAAAFPVRSVS
jgi:hypothetical protein